MTRSYQKGSISLHNGNWTGRYMDRSQNERHQRRVFLGSGITKREARKKLELLLDSLAPTAKLNLTFAEFVTKWEPVFQSQYKPSTWLSVQSILRKQLLPAFGEKKLAEITVEDVQTYISRPAIRPYLKNEEASGPYLRSALTYFRKILQTAKLWGYTINDPCEGIMLPRATPTARRYFSDIDARRIINHSQEPYRTLYWLLAQTGMRIGEALALDWKDVDFEKNVIHVEKNLYKGVIQTPKSAAGFRIISISPLLAARLKEYKETHRDGLLFTGRSAQTCEVETLRRHLQRTLKHLGINRAGFHAFRHANATILDKIQAPMGVRQQRLGHKSIQTTLDIYTHAADNGEVAQRMDEVLQIEQIQ